MGTPHPSQVLLKDLRHCLASAISGFKAYDVESVCKRIGLRTNDNGDPFNSKYKYAMSCLLAESGEAVLQAARNLLAEETDYNLSESADKFIEASTETISEITRRRIIAIFDSSPLCTEIDEIEMLRRLWPIDNMKTIYESDSLEPKTLADDIWQHTVNNNDWSNRELLEHVGGLSCSQAQFFRFLALITDPLVQMADRQAELIEKINSCLFHDGYKLVQVRVRSGCPFFEVRSLPQSGPGDANISQVLKAFNPDDVHARWTAAMESRESDPRRAITLARTLLEDVCKWVLAEAGETWKEKDDLPVLYRRLSSVLKLAPDAHTEDTFKQILGSCQNIVESLGSLRNKLGDAHSIGPLRARPSSRHAELAVNLAGSMSTFLVSTWRIRQREAASTKEV